MIDKTYINKPPHVNRIAVTNDDSREYHGKVILDDGTHGPEWAIMDTILLFKQELVERFELKGLNKFQYFSRCVTGQAATHWSNLMETEFPLTDRSNKDFDAALVCYIEEVADLHYLQDSILEFLAKYKKPFVMENKDYIYCHATLYKYASGKYTRESIAIPGNIEKTEL